MWTSKIIFLSIFVGAVVGIFFAMKQKAVGPRLEQPIILLRPTPTPVPQEAVSIDGSKKLLVRQQRQADGTTMYTVVAVDRTGANERVLLAKTEPAGTSLELHNSWAPGDTYVFVGEKGPAGEKFFVLQASGAAFADGQTALDVGALFVQKKTGYLFDKVTGWASPTLLILYTKTDAGAKGPSYWFELPSRAFIQLAR